MGDRVRVETRRVVTLIILSSKLIPNFPYSKSTPHSPHLSIADMELISHNSRSLDRIPNYKKKNRNNFVGKWLAPFTLISTLNNYNFTVSNLLQCGPFIKSVKKHKRIFLHFPSSFLMMEGPHCNLLETIEL